MVGVIELRSDRSRAERIGVNCPEYKEVVVIGNGPSGIVLSYFLAGNWPYYNGLGEDANEMLHYRLITNGGGVNTATQKSIVEQDLIFLSQGLEGRSSNPVALLFDTLNHPQADLGLELPSLLNWKFSPSSSVDHVVIGRGPRPGGAWQSMDGSVLTISLGCWMELPEMNFREWEAQQESRCFRESRAPVSSVAQYYCDYVKAHHLEKYFLGDSYVTEVNRVPLKCLPENCDRNNLNNGNRENDSSDISRCIRRRHTIGEIPLNFNQNSFRARNQPLFEVKGYSRNVRNVYEPFTYYTKNVVLATGASDESNILGVSGENLPFVLHSLNHLENLIASGGLNQDSDPIVIVGAGLSAADAIIAARFHSIPVVHVFRRSVDDPNLIFRQLPENMYPEYHKVYQMMKDPTGYEGYKGLEQHILTEIRPDRKVRIVGPNCCGIV